MSSPNSAEFNSGNALVVAISIWGVIGIVVLVLAYPTKSPAIIKLEQQTAEMQRKAQIEQKKEIERKYQPETVTNWSKLQEERVTAKLEREREAAAKLSKKWPGPERWEWKQP